MQWAVSTEQAELHGRFRSGRPRRRILPYPHTRRRLDKVDACLFRWWIGEFCARQVEHGIIVLLGPHGWWLWQQLPPLAVQFAPHFVRGFPNSCFLNQLARHRAHQVFVGIQRLQALRSPASCPDR